MRIHRTISIGTLALAMIAGLAALSTPVAVQTTISLSNSVQNLPSGTQQTFYCPPIRVHPNFLDLAVTLAVGF